MTPGSTALASAPSVTTGAAVGAQRLLHGHRLGPIVIVTPVGLAEAGTTLLEQVLASHPDEQTAARAEVAEVLDDRTPTAEDLPSLEYVRRCLQEAMRLYPPAWITGRAVAGDTTVAGYNAPAGSVVTTPFSVLHVDPAIWPDPQRFDPSRFTPDAVKARDRYAYLPFGGGPRSCIGDHFAMLEATLALAVTLQRWELRAQPRRVRTRPGITQRAAEPVLAEVAEVAAA